MGGSAPAQDPQMGRAALLSAQTGQDTLDFFKKQSAITNGWATDDRARYQNTFLPLQNDYITAAKSWASPERIGQRQDAAAADVQLQVAQAGDARKRDAMAMGVNPASGRFAGMAQREGMGAALAATGARNTAQRQVEGEAETRMANAINLGSGLAINPGTSIGLSNGAGQAGGSAAMSGYGQQASILNQDYQNRYNAWQSSQGGLGALAGGVGSLIGAFSSKKAKTDKRPMDGALRALGAMPVERWRYKDGIEDGGEHIGPYAEDMKRATGVGDGKSIKFMDAIGLTMGAVKELAAKVDMLATGGMGAARAA